MLHAPSIARLPIRGTTTYPTSRYRCPRSEATNDRPVALERPVPRLPLPLTASPSLDAEKKKEKKKTRLTSEIHRDSCADALVEATSDHKDPHRRQEHVWLPPCPMPQLALANLVRKLINGKVASFASRA